MTRTVTLICCLVAAVGLAFYIATHPFHPENRLQDLQLTIGYGLLIIIFFLERLIGVDLPRLISPIY